MTIVSDSALSSQSVHDQPCSVLSVHGCVEEGPAVCVPPEIWSEMERRAVQLAKAVGYIGAGTIEYLYHEGRQEYTFLELNPRLQVEHPVTERISGVNLPSAQLQIAMGIPLEQISDIRRLFPDLDDTRVDLDNTPQLQPVGHTIACRITAENPTRGFKPTSGELLELSFQSLPNVWGYFSLEANGAVHEYSDSQFGHIFAFGNDRAEARANMAYALTLMSHRGEISTTVEYLQTILETDDFKSNQLSTSWLEAQYSSIERVIPDRIAVLMAGAVFSYSSLRDRLDALLARLRNGHWIYEEDLRDFYTHTEVVRLNGVKYDLTVHQTAASTMDISLNGCRYGPVLIQSKPSSNGHIITLEGHSYHIVEHGNDRQHVSIDGHNVALQAEDDIPCIRADLPGTLIRYIVQDGEHAKEGDLVAEIESMKMHVSITMPVSGTVHHVIAPSQKVRAGEILTHIALDSPEEHVQNECEPFTGTFGDPIRPRLSGEEAYQADLLRAIETGYTFGDAIPHRLPIQESRQAVVEALNGYSVHDSDVLSALHILANGGNDPNASLLMMKEALNGYVGRVSPNSLSRIRAILRYNENSAEIMNSIDLGTVISQCRALPRSEVDDDEGAWNALHHELGLLADVPYAVARIFNSLLQSFLKVEERFKGRKEDVAFKVPDILEEMGSTDTAHILIAHAAVTNRSYLISSVLDCLETRPELWFRSLLAPSLLRILQLSTRATPSSSTHNMRHNTARLLVRLYSASSFNNWIRPDQDDLMILEKMARYPELLPGLLGDGSFPTSNTLWLSCGVSEFSKSASVRCGGQSFYLHSVEDLQQRMSSLKGAHGDIINAWLWGHESFPVHEHVYSDVFLDIANALSNTLNGATIAFSVIGSQNGLQEVAFGPEAQFLELYHGLNPLIMPYLEIDKLSTYDITPLPGISRSLGVFKAHSNGRECNYNRIFVRGAFDFTSTSSCCVDDEVQSTFLLIFETALMSYPHDPFNRDSHMFIHILLEDPAQAVALKSSAINSISQHADALANDNIDEIEIRLSYNRPEHSSTTLVICNPTGVAFVMSTYSTAPDSNGVSVYSCEDVIMFSSSNSDEIVSLPLDHGFGSRHGSPCDSKYQPRDQLSNLRDNAKKLGTVMPYDLISLFSYSMSLSCKEIDRPFSAVELCRVEDGSSFAHMIDDIETFRFYKLVPVRRRPDNIQIGVIGWICDVFCKSNNSFRKIVLIANDISVKGGSFSVDELDMFNRLSSYARAFQLPRIFITGNAGARIGMDQDLDQYFKVEWEDRTDPSKGVKNLYVEPDHLEKVKDYVITEPEQECSENGSSESIRHRLVGIVGASSGIGVEILAGSGLIAGETANAYDKTFTLTYVSARSVGIGAHLVRLGQRVIQKVDGRSSMDLTGNRAINQVLGNNVYKNNRQLGGPEIMFGNGVSHQVVQDDLEGVQRILQWLEFVPVDATQETHALASEPYSRAMTPPGQRLNGQYDPRLLITGDDEGFNGLFDKGSWVETLAGWAKTVVCGRARLGGIAVGVIAAESRHQYKVTPADPVFADSKQETRPQPGSVLFFDSSHKVAQTIRDLERERLPIMILANWRGFSSGQRDMWDEVLKAGSAFVDALRQCSVPVMVYLAPMSELRGGAWGVFDRNINPNMEFYADPESRGGILEPAEPVEIIYGQQKQDTVSHRLLQDPEHLDDITSWQASVQNVTENYFNLKDIPDGKEAVDVINGNIPWNNSRRFFYWRLRYLLLECDLLKEVEGVGRARRLAMAMIVDDPGEHVSDLDLLRICIESNARVYSKQFDTKTDQGYYEFLLAFKGILKQHYFQTFSNAKDG